MRTAPGKIKILFQQRFLKSAGILIGGTAFAQAIAILILPLLTRLYTPEDFGVLAAYSSILGIVSVVACLRFEIAIPLPKKDASAANLLAVALCSSTGVAIFFSVIIYFYSERMMDLMGQEKGREYLWLLPLGVWLSGIYSAAQFWATRQKKFSRVARTRVFQAVGGAGTQIAWGWYLNSPFGLILGQLVNVGGGVYGLLRGAMKEDISAIRKIHWRRMRRVIKAYSKFPRYSVPEAVANTAGIQLPILLIAAMAVGPEAGYLMLVMRIMQAPIGLIGGAVGQIYLSRAAQELRENNLDKFTATTILGLIRLGGGPLIFLGIVSPVVFPLVFGVQWQRAGEIATWMTPWFVFQLVTSPVSMVMHVRGWQKAMLLLTLTGLVLRLGTTILAAQYDRSHFSEYYALSGAFFYATCLCVFLKAAGISMWEMGQKFKGSFFAIGVWAMLAVAFRCLIEFL